MMDDSLKETEPESPAQAANSSTLVARTRRAGPAAMALVIGLAAMTAQASESDLVRDIQRYCTVCWRNARLDPMLWDDCTQEVCCRLLTKARAGELELAQVLADDTPESPGTGPGDRHGPQTGAANQATPGDRRRIAYGCGS